MGEVASGSAAEKAGLQPGDLLLRWRRLPNPPYNPESAEGPLRSPIDVAWLEVEEAPRGPIVLLGERNGTPIQFQPGEDIPLTDVSMTEEMQIIRRQCTRLLEDANPLGCVPLWEDFAARNGGQFHRDSAAWLLLELGSAAIKKNYDWETGGTIYRAADRVASNPASRAMVLNLAANDYMAHDRYEMAKKTYDDALEILRADLHEGPGFAHLLRMRGQASYAQGEFDETAVFWGRSLEIIDRYAPESFLAVLTVNAIAVLSYNRGEMDAAEKGFLSVRERLEKLAPESRQMASCLLNLGSLAHARADYQEAEAFYLEALSLEQRGGADKLSMSIILNNLGAIASSNGDLALAAERIGRALTLTLEVRPGSIDVAAKLLNLGSVALDRGRLEEAAEHWFRALAIHEAASVENLSTAVLLSNLGVLENQRGDRVAAEYYYRRALAISRDLAPSSMDTAIKMHNYAVLLSMNGNHVTALKMLQDALEIKGKISPQGPEVADGLHSIGTVHLNQKDYLQASRYYEEALKVSMHLAPYSVDVATTLNQLGLVLPRVGREDEAEIYLQDAYLLLLDVAPESHLLPIALANLGGVYRRRNCVEAADYHMRAVDFMEKRSHLFASNPEAKGRFRTEYINMYRDAADLLLELGRQESAFRILQQAHARSFLELLAERDLVLVTDLGSELDEERRRTSYLYGREYEALQEAKRVEDRRVEEEAEARFVELRRRREAIAEEIRRKSPRLAALQDPQPVGVDDLRELLDPGTLVLTYSVRRDNAVVLSVSGRHPLRHEVLATDLEEVGRQVQGFRDLVMSVTSSRAPRAENLRRHARSLYRTLMAPVEHRIGESERLLIVADRPLYALPWGALLRQQASGEEQFLIEWKPLHLALSATVYAELLRERRDADLSQPDRIVVFGDPVYPERGDALTNHPDAVVRSKSAFDWKRLVHAQAEVDGIVQIFPGRVTAYVREAATEEKVFELGRDVDVVHFATHGHADEDFPLSSFLALTIPEKVAEGQANGLLQAWEIFERFRADAELVVLSACVTGVGGLQDGEGIIGLTRAFQYAGARSVLATLWQVNDSSTTELMTRFYRHLRAGKRKAEALRAAQLELIRDPVVLTTPDGEELRRDDLSPFFWAGYQLYGDWR